MQKDLYGLQMQVVYFLEATWEDSSVFGLPHATKYNAGVDTSFDVTLVIRMVQQFILNMKQESINKKQRQPLWLFQQILHQVIMILHKK